MTASGLHYIPSLNMYFNDNTGEAPAIAALFLELMSAIRLVHTGRRKW